MSTASVDEAEWKLSGSLAPCRIRKLSDPDRFDFTMNGIQLPRTSLIYNDYGCGADVDVELPEGSVSFLIGDQTPTRLELEGKTHVLDRDAAVLISSTDRMRIQRGEHAPLLVLRASAQDLRAHLDSLTDRYHRGTPRLDRSIPLTAGAGRSLRRLMLLLTSEFDGDDHLVKNIPLRRCYDEALLTALLSLSRDASQELFEGRSQPLTPAIVYRAEEYLKENLDEPIAVSDLLRICGCSRRALSLAFKSTRGYSSMEFLTEQRLLAAQAVLRKARPGETVTSVAYACGFTHLGRFSQVYKRRFGESPSVTLRPVK